MGKTKNIRYKFFLPAFAFGVVGAIMTLSLVLRSNTAKADLTYMAVDFDELVAMAQDVKYLSDGEPYNNVYSYAPYRKDAYDANGSKISLRYNGQTVTFDKGLYAHATNNIYYDLAAIDPERQFTHFVAYEGINTTSTGSGCDGVIFRIYGSNNPDGDWQILDNDENAVQAQTADAKYVKVDLQGYRYLRLETHQNGGNGKDHSAWGDAKLVKADYAQYSVPDIEKYNQDVLAFGDADLATNSAYELAVLRREFADRVGQYAFSNFVESSAENRRMLDWLFNDLQNMRWFILGGEPRGGNYLSSLNILSKLYAQYGSDTVDATATGYDGLTNGDVYTKMMISLALSHDAPIAAWYDSREVIDPAVRYGVYKNLYLEDLLEKKVFVRLEVEEMREVMMAVISDDEIKWLNNLAREKGASTSQGYNLNPYSYINYTFGYNYSLSKYYDEANRETWDEKWKLSEYGVPYGVSGKPKLWIVFEEGSVCGGLSKTGSNLWNVFGLPATVVGQPGHAAYIGMSMDDEGDGWWSLGNDVFGWQKSEKRERFLLGWGSPLMHSGYNVSYFSLGQDAINDVEGYTLAEETLMLKDLYGDDVTKLETMYREALSIQDINLDAWYGLIQLYLGDENTPESVYVGLAEEIAEKMKNYPLPMVKLMELIQDKITSAGGIARYTAAQKSALERGTVATNDDTKQSAVTRRMATYLLGQNDYTMATFSFDGENAGKIMLGQRYQDVMMLQYQYSLDGGNTWETKTIDNNSVDRNVQLTKTELSRITAEDDIKVRIVGANDVIYTIDITQAAVPANLYANDQENRVMGTDLTMEWREVITAEGEKTYGEWTSYRVSSPLRMGDVTVQVRKGATGTALPSEPSVEYSFTDDGEKDEQYSYIPVSNMSLAAVSTEALGSGQLGNAVNAIDGNFYTRWHSNWNGNDTERYIVIKFNHAVNLSRLEYVSAGGGNGHIKKADFYVSTSDEMNAEDFALVGQLTDDCSTVQDGVTCHAPWSGMRHDTLPENLVPESFDFDETINGVRYVAIKVQQTSDGTRFASARMFNFYEDLRNVPKNPTASITYSTRQYTNENVLARLVEPSTELHDLRLLDSAGNEIAVGDNNDLFERVDDTSVLIKENGEYKFTFTDSNGLEGQATVSVNWIDREAPVGRIEYNRGENNPTNQSVTAKLIITNGDTVTVKNNLRAPLRSDVSVNSGNGDNVDADGNEFDPEQSDGLVWDPFTYTFEDNGEFTFEFEDAAGNKGTATARVDWIDKIPPKAVISYSTMSETEGTVVARVLRPSELTEHDGIMRLATDEDEEFVVLNNGGSNEYEFTQNGTFVFRISDRAGNEVEVVATVDWIKEKQQPSEPSSPSEPGGSDESSRPNVPSSSEIPVVPNRPSGSSGANAGSTGSGQLAVGNTASENVDGSDGDMENNEADSGKDANINRPSNDGSSSEKSDSNGSTTDSGDEMSNADSKINIWWFIGGGIIIVGIIFMVIMNKRDSY